jgi:hypothetical protein
MPSHPVSLKYILILFTHLPLGLPIGGMIIGRENRSTLRKPTPVSLCPPQTPHACPDANPSRRGGKPATNHLSYGTAC